MGESIIQVLWLSAIQLVYLIGVFIAVGFILGVLEKYSNGFLTKAFGRKGVLLTALIGTPIHEMGHALMCIPFGHKIVKVKLLQVNDPNGVLGYVEHSYNPKNIYHRVGTFFIGIAPVISGIVALVVGMYFLVPTSYEVFHAYLEKEVNAGQINMGSIESMFYGSLALINSLFSVTNIMNPLFWVYLLFAISVSSHIALSPTDIKGATVGVLTLFILLIGINIIGSVTGLETDAIVQILSKYNAYILAFSSIAFIFSLLTFIISWILYRLKKIIV